MNQVTPAVEVHEGEKGANVTIRTFVSLLRSIAEKPNAPAW